MIIRNFEPRDLEALAGFKQESVETSFPGREYDLGPFRERILGSDPETIRVAEDSGRIAGYIWFRARNSAGGRHGVINHTFVHQDYRHQGLSLKLNQAAEDWFRTKGITRIEVTVSDNNEPSLGMCRKLGYRETRTVFEKML